MDGLEEAILSKHNDYTTFDYWKCVKILVEEHNMSFDEAMDEMERVYEDSEGTYLTFVK